MCINTHMRAASMQISHADLTLQVSAAGTIVGIRVMEWSDVATRESVQVTDSTATAPRGVQTRKYDGISRIGSILNKAPTHMRRQCLPTANLQTHTHAISSTHMRT